MTPFEMLIGWGTMLALFALQIRFLIIIIHLIGDVDEYLKKRESEYLKRRGRREDDGW